MSSCIFLLLFHRSLAKNLPLKAPGTHLLRANFEQIREEAAGTGLITNEEVAQMLTLLDDPDFAISAPILFSAWGRRP